MEKLKTLKDLQKLKINLSNTVHNNKEYTQGIEHSIRWMKKEAVKWYHRSDGDKHKFIKEFFGITEQEIKEESASFSETKQEKVK